MRATVLAASAVALTACTFGMYATPKSQQRDALASHAPAQLQAAETEKDPESATRVVRVLVLLDDDYAARSLHAEEDVRRQFARASRYTASTLDTRFQVVSVDRWPHRLGGDSLGKAVEDLERFQPGEGVDWVVGFVSSMLVVEANHDALGMGRLFGKHAVLRGYSDAAEMGEVRREFRALDDTEILEHFRKHKEHKQTCLLLHEWAHSLGAPHDATGKGFMNPMYSRMQSGFSPASLQVLKAVLPARLARAGLPEQQKLLKAALEKLPPGAVDPRERELTAAAAEAAAAPAPIQVGFTPEERERYTQATQLYNAGMYTQVESQLAPLIARHPGEGVFRSLECQAAIAAAPGEKASVLRCEAGAKAARDAPGPQLTLASAQLRARNPAAAVDALASGVERLKAAPQGNAEMWPFVAQLARQLSCVSLAEEAVARAGATPATEPISAWAARTRRWTSLPAPLPSCEREHVEGFRSILQVMERNLGQAQSRIAAFPKGPARDSLSCELALRKNDRKMARQACERTLVAFPDSTHARYLLGVLAEQESKPAEVVTHLEKLISLDPDNDDAWARLAAAHRKLGQSAQLQALQERFQRKFGRPLR